MNLLHVLCFFFVLQEAAIWQLSRPSGNAAGDFSISPLNLGTGNSTVDIYVLPTDLLYTDAEVNAILEWASYGRGIVVAGASWDVAGFSGTAAKDLPANKVLRPFGLQVRARACTLAQDLDMCARCGPCIRAKRDLCQWLLCVHYMALLGLRLRLKGSSLQAAPFSPQ